MSQSSSSATRPPFTISARQGKWQISGGPRAGWSRRLLGWMHGSIHQLRRRRQPRPVQLEFNWDATQSIPVSGWRAGRRGVDASHTTDRAGSPTPCRRR